MDVLTRVRLVSFNGTQAKPCEEFIPECDDYWRMIGLMGLVIADEETYRKEPWATPQARVLVRFYQNIEGMGLACHQQNPEWANALWIRIDDLEEVPVHRYISVFDRSDEHYVGDIEFKIQPKLTFLQELFVISRDSPMYDEYPIDPQIADRLAVLINDRFDLERFEYYLSCVDGYEYTNIDGAVRKLVSVFQGNDEALGRMEYSSSKLPVSFPVFLTGELLYFYRHVILDDHPSFNSPFLEFIEPGSLLTVLGGHGGWDAPPNEQQRWVSEYQQWVVDKGFRATDEESTWRDSYRVFATTVEDDHLFCDGGDSFSPVYGSCGGRNFQVAESLAGFLRLYARLVEVGQVDFGGDICDDDFNYYAQYLTAIHSELGKSLPPDLAAGFFYFFWG